MQRGPGLGGEQAVGLGVGVVVVLALAQPAIDEVAASVLDRFCQIPDHGASQARDLVIERAAVRLGEGCLAAPDGAGSYVVV